MNHILLLFFFLAVLGFEFLASHLVLPLESSPSPMNHILKNSETAGFSLNIYKAQIYFEVLQLISFPFSPLKKIKNF
jgi:hypothetical protein